MGYYAPGNIGTLEAKKGQLYKLEKDGVLSSHLDQVDLSNGLAWSPDNKTLYYIDSLQPRIDAFDYDINNGSISENQTLYSILLILSHDHTMT
jgi:gluconolactonase